MNRIARYIMSGLLLATQTLALSSCDLITKPEDILYHVAIFNDSQDDVKVQCLNPDVKGQGGTYVLYHGSGVASWDIKKYPHTFVFKHIFTGEVLRTVTLEPNSITADRSHNGVNKLDAFYVYGSGEWQNCTAPVTNDTK